MIESQLPALLLMFGLGLLGAGHCFGMCGGIISALGFASDKGAARFIFAYNLGRIFSYACAGALVASLGYASATYLALGPLLRGMAGLLLIAMGVSIAGWWQALSWLEKAGNIVWQRIQPLGRGLLPVRSFSSAVMLGVLWGWLPCGLVYTALAFAATAQTPYEGMLQMAAFGSGTIPAVVLGGLSTGKLGQLLQNKKLRLAFACLLIIYGVWTLLAAISGSHH